MRVPADQHVSYAVQEALVDAAGKMFWYRAPFGRLLQRAGVPRARVKALLDTGESKYAVMRVVLAELDEMGSAGARVQRQLVRELVAVEPTDDVPDLAQAREARAKLRKLAEESEIVAASGTHNGASIEKARAAERRAAAVQKQQAAELDRTHRAELSREYGTLVQDTTDKQGRGYRLEEILGEVARLDGLSWVPPFRKGTVSQTDGMVSHAGFQYLIEARWRSDPADVAALGAFSAKIARSLQSTRGLFVSIAGFREEVVAETQTGTKNLLLMTGRELAFVLEGRLTLSECLRLKVEEGAKKGVVFYDVAEHAS